MLLNVNVNHDASHNTFSRNVLINRFIGRLVTLPLGGDPDYWRVRHVVYLSQFIAELATRFGIDYQNISVTELLHLQHLFLKSMGEDPEGEAGRGKGDHMTH